MELNLKGKVAVVTGGSMVAFLASDQASFITGAVFLVNGGSVGTV